MSMMYEMTVDARNGAPSFRFSLTLFLSCRILSGGCSKVAAVDDLDIGHAFFLLAGAHFVDD